MPNGEWGIGLASTGVLEGLRGEGVAAKDDQLRLGALVLTDHVPVAAAAAAAANERRLNDMSC